MLRIAVIDPHIENTATIVQDRIDHSFAGATKITFELTSWLSFWAVIKAFKNNVFDTAILPLRRAYILKLQYWLCIIAMFFIRAKKKYFIGLGGDIKEFYTYLAGLSFILQPFISIIIIVRLPYYVVREVFGNYMMTKEKKGDEFVGFGKGKAANNIIYWLAITKKAKKYGLFGLAHDNYMGLPIGLHNWPFAVLTLGSLGFRNYVYLSALLLGIGFGWIGIAAGHPTLLWFMPLIFLSTFFLYNVNVGNWEILAWGLSALSMAGYFIHWPLMSAIFLALVLLTHPGVALITCVFLTAFSLLDQRPVMDLAVFYLLSAIFVIWWLIPYREASSKLGRNHIINKFWDNQMNWSLPSLYQAFIFFLFLCAAIMTGKNKALAVLLILPLVFLYYNTKVKWIFSGYTITNFMLFSGAIYLALQPSLIAGFMYLLVIYTSNAMLWLYPGVSLWGFDLTPLTYGETGPKVLRAFNSLPAGRIAVEMSKKHSHTWDVMPSLGYILADSNIEFFNGGYTENGDHHIFEKYCQYFNIEATSSQFESACQEAGIQYFVTCSPGFTQELRQRGHPVVTTLDNLYFSRTPNEAPVSLTIFKLPWEATLIEPKTEIIASVNSIRFTAKQGIKYWIKYSSFKGWHAWQGNDRIDIEDANPGILIKALRDGEVALKYSLANYWL